MSDCQIRTLYTFEQNASIFKFEIPTDYLIISIVLILPDKPYILEIKI